MRNRDAWITQANPGLRHWVLAVLTGFLVAAPASATELTTIADRLGANRTQFEALLSHADCLGPNGSFTTEIISLADGTVRFVQLHGTERAEILVSGDVVRERAGNSDTLRAAPSIMEAFVRGHEVHRILLELDHRFVINNDRRDGEEALTTASESKSASSPCIKLTQASPLLRSRTTTERGGRADLCLDTTTELPSSLEMEISDSLGGGTVRIEFADWRTVLGVQLPHAVDFIHDGQRFTYRFTKVLPFRIAPGAPLPNEPHLYSERLGDLAEVASMHRDVLAAHLSSNVDSLLMDTARVGTTSGRGKLSTSSIESTRERLGPYLESTRFHRYEDTAVPIIAISQDGTLGWLGCEIEAAGEQTDETGQTVSLEFGFSWIELLAREKGRWTKIGTASSQRP